MGEVYEATQVQLARRVALKTVRADLATKPELLARFRREAESAAALGHPNIVQVTDFQANPGEPAFLVMELLEGATLADTLEREGRIEPSRAAFIAVQVLSGLAAAHRAGIVHRDVKPANVFLQATSVMRDLVKVLDFGVAKLALEATPGAHAMTQAGQVLGTLAYMAPEQAISGAAVDGRTDIFGVGATLFHALSGVRPFDATEPGVGRAPLERIAPWVNRELAAVIERALQRSPDARWANADEMAAALSPFVASAGARVSANPPPGSAPEVERSGWDPAAIGRLEAPTGGAEPTAYSRVASASAPPGAVPITMPARYAPPYPPQYPSSPPPPPRPYVHAAAPGAGGKPWWLLLVALVALGVAAPYAFSLLAIRNATNPDTIATNIEREVLKQPKPPCPQFEQCLVKTEEHDLTYTTCTNALSSSRVYRPGEMVLAGKETRVAVITSELPGRRHRARFLTAKAETDIGDDEIIGRLCNPGSAAQLR